MTTLFLINGNNVVDVQLMILVPSAIPQTETWSWRMAPWSTKPETYFGGSRSWAPSPGFGSGCLLWRLVHNFHCSLFGCCLPGPYIANFPQFVRSLTSNIGPFFHRPKFQPPMLMQPGRWCCPRASWAVHRSRGWCRWRVQLPHPPLPLDDERSCAGVQPSWATGLRGQKAEAGCWFFERIGVPNNLIKLIDYQTGYHGNLSYIVVGYVFFDHGRALIGLDGHCQCLQRATCCTSPSTAGTSWSSLRPSWIGPRLGCNEWPLGPWMLWRRGRKGRSVLRMATGGSWAKASSCVGSRQCARCRRRRGSNILWHLARHCGTKTWPCFTALNVEPSNSLTMEQFLAPVPAVCGLLQKAAVGSTFWPTRRHRWHRAATWHRLGSCRPGPKHVWLY